MMSAEIFAGIDFHVQKNYLKKIRDEYLAANYMEHVMEVVTTYFNISSALIKSKSRKREIVIPRQIAMYFMWLKNIYSYKEIGIYFNRDHSTVVYSKDTVKDLMDMDKKYNRKIIEIERLLE